MAVAGRQVAECAGADYRLGAMSDDLRHRRMLVGKPVRRIESVVDLRLRVLPAAARHLLEDEIVLRLGLRCDRISPIRRLGGKCGSREQSKRQSGSDVFHGYPQRDWPTRLSGESRNWKEMAQQPVELLRTGQATLAWSMLRRLRRHRR